MKLRIFAFFLWLLPLSLQAFPLTDARNLALGGMSVSSSNIETALYINPAILSRSENLKTSFSQAKTSIDTLGFGVSGAFPLWKGDAGLSLGWDAQVAQNQVQKAVVKDANGQVVIDPMTGLPLTQILGFFTRSDNSFYCSAGARAGIFSIGASLKYFLSDFGSAQGSGWGLDLGFHVLLGSNLSFGSTLFDLQDTTIGYRGGAPNQILPMSCMAGFSWAFWQDEHFSFSVEPGLYGRGFDAPAWSWSAGLEGSWEKNIFARVGFNQDRVSLGAGLVARLGKGFPEVKIDYAYLGGNTGHYPSRLTLATTW